MKNLIELLKITRLLFVVVFLVSCHSSSSSDKTVYAPQDQPAVGESKSQPYAQQEIRQTAKKVPGNMPPPPPAKPSIESKPDIDTDDFLKDSKHNTEEYSDIPENPFLEATKNPLSTFSIDVDAASYSNMRRFISSHTLPPAGSVRIEEFINYFTYDYPQPKDGHPFSITTEIDKCPWNGEHQVLHIGLQGKKMDIQELPPNNLVFLLDVSGSMNNYDKLPLLKKAIHLLVNEMRPNDRVAIVVYAGAAGLVLPSTSFDEKGKILQAIERLSAGGSTAGGAGIQLAYKEAQKNFIKNGNNRIILATDGDFNVGASSEASLVKMIEEKRKSGVFLTVLGFGTGNYKDARMEQLADKGNGNYAYIDNIMEAKKVLVNEIGATLFTIAKDVKLQIEFNPAKVKSYRLIGYENRMLRTEDFNDDTKDAGELGAGHSVTALYEIVPADSNEPTASVDALKYQKTDIKPSAMETDEWLTVKFRYKAPDATTSRLIVHPVKESSKGIVSNNLPFSAAVASFGMILRDSENKGESSYKLVKRLANRAKGEDKLGYRAEFIRLVEQAEALDM
ncbi:MAG: vWA domain-containing protein [Chitinophagales bacterium]